MAESASGQDVVNPAFWLASQGQDMGSSCPPGISRVSTSRKSSLFGHLINPLLTKLVWSRWQYIGLVLFCIFIDLHFVYSIKNVKRNLAKSSLFDRLAWSITHLNLLRVAIEWQFQDLSWALGNLQIKKACKTKKVKFFTADTFI